MTPSPATTFTARYLVKRKKGMSFAEFRRYQLEVHVPLVMELPGLTGYELAFFAPIDGVDQAFDAIAEVTFQSAAAHDTALMSPQGAKALADLANYLHEPQNNTVLRAQPGDSLTFS